MSDFHVAETLADLEARKREIDQAIAILKKIYRPGTASPPAEPTGVTEAQSKSLIDAVVEVLRERGCIMAPAEIVMALEDTGFEIGGLDKHRNVGATLNRGKKSGLLTNPERGQWGLAEWGETGWGATAASEIAQRAGLPLSDPPETSGTF